ncbi:MAG: hypothetical protein ACK4E3_09975 [Brevundimonas sp.]|jgi:hypothetical protein|uniref:hypothetical protein n=1 Tax=Brevundimonas sp. TaxID=1871086 RepID=UPI00391C3EDD
MIRSGHLRESADLVSTRLHDAEEAIDMALARTAAFGAELPGARLRARLSATTGEASFRAVADAISALTDAREKLASVHRQLAAIARMKGLPGHAVGPFDKPEEDGPVRGGGITESACEAKASLLQRVT